MFLTRIIRKSLIRQCSGAVSHKHLSPHEVEWRLTVARSRLAKAADYDPDGLVSKEVAAAIASIDLAREELSGRKTIKVSEENEKASDKLLELIELRNSLTDAIGRLKAEEISGRPVSDALVRLLAAAAKVDKKMGIERLDAATKHRWNPLVLVIVGIITGIVVREFYDVRSAPFEDIESSKDQERVTK